MIRTVVPHTIMTIVCYIDDTLRPVQNMYSAFTLPPICIQRNFSSYLRDGS